MRQYYNRSYPQLVSKAKSLSTGFRIRYTHNIYTHNINALTKNFYFSVSFNPHSDHPVEFFPTGRGKRSDKNSKLNYMNSVFKVLKPMQGESKDDLPRMPSRNGASACAKPNVGKRLSNHTMPTMQWFGHSVLLRWRRC